MEFQTFNMFHHEYSPRGIYDILKCTLLARHVSLIIMLYRYTVRYSFENVNVARQKMYLKDEIIYHVDTSVDKI